MNLDSFRDINNVKIRVCDFVKDISTNEIFVVHWRKKIGLYIYSKRRKRKVTRELVKSLEVVSCKK